MMKKVFLFIFAVLFTMLCITAASATTGDTQGGDTLFSRVYEFVAANKEVVTTAVGLLTVFATSIVEAKKSKKRSDDIAKDVMGVLKNTSNVASSQAGVEGVVNGLIDSYNGLTSKYEKYEGIEDDRNRLVGALVIQTTTILEILSAVYANSKNLPQGVKDIVNLKYAHCLQKMDSDEALRAVVDMVRQSLGIAVEVKEDDPEAEQGQDTEAAGVAD
jgi:hypothetical protein